VSAELVVTVVVVALDDGLLEPPVHPFDQIILRKRGDGTLWRLYLTISAFRLRPSTTA
jgi:hypothetical protein